MAKYLGDAFAGMTANTAVNTARRSLRLVNSTSLTSQDRAGSRVNAGEKWTVFWNRPNSTNNPNKVSAKILYETGSGLVLRTLVDQGADPADGTSWDIYATDDMTDTGNPIAGTFRLYVRITKDDSAGGTFDYDVDSDGVIASVGTGYANPVYTVHQGKIVSNLVVSEIKHQSGYPAGTKHGYGTAADESVTVRSIYSPPPEVRGHEKVIFDLLDGAAVQIAGSAQAVAAGGYSDLSIVVDETNFDLGLKTYGARLTPSGLAQLQADSEGSALWTEFVTNTTANLLTIDSVSADENAGTLTFTVARANPDGASSVDFATADGAGESGEAGAITGEDFTDTSGTLNFTGAEATKTIVVPLIDNSYAEPQRKFPVTLSAPSNATIQAGTGIGTITDDEAPKTFLQDFSGNGRDLTAGSTATSSVNCEEFKFGKGRAFADVANETLTRADAAFGISGDFCATLVFSVDELPDAAQSYNLITYGLSGRGMNNATGCAFVFGVSAGVTNDWEFRQDNGAGGQQLFGETAASVGEHTVTIRRDGTAKTLVVKVDGSEVINTTYTDTPVVDAGAVFALGGRGDGNNTGSHSGNVYDVRIFDTLVSQSQLDEIVASSGKCKPLGTELAWYRLEDT